MSKVRTCVCCGNKYAYCPNCNHDPSWKMLYDTEKCKEIVNIVSGYNMKIVSKDRAAQLLKEINVGDASNYKEDIAVILKEISNSSVEKPKRRRRKK